MFTTRAGATVWDSRVIGQAGFRLDLSIEVKSYIESSVFRPCELPCIPARRMRGSLTAVNITPLQHQHLFPFGLTLPSKTHMGIFISN